MLLSRLKRWLHRSPPVYASPIAEFEYNGHAGVFERTEGEPLPIVRAFGWFEGTMSPPILLDTDQRNGVEATVCSRILRPDVQAANTDRAAFSGFRADYVLEPGEQPAQLRINDRVLHAFAPDAGYATLEPHYRRFFTQDQVMGRDRVYGYGPPADPSPEFIEFVLQARGKVLDFGCGNGQLVLALRESGNDATGIELDQPRIRNALKPGVAPYVRLYAGETPLPFETESFDWIVSTEVIEHIADISRYIPELHRLLRPGGRLLLTTPDITSIPSSFPAGVVPWHLLESTHVNFFTPASVASLLASHFDMETTYCLGSTRVNGHFVPGSIGAVLVRRPAANELPPETAQRRHAPATPEHAR